MISWSNSTKKVENGTLSGDIDVLEFVEKQKSSQNRKKNEDRKYSRSSKNSGILRKYLLFILKATLVCLVSVAMIVLSSLLGINSIRFLYTEQYKLYFVNGMSKTVSMAYLAYREVFSTNATVLMRNQPVSTQFDLAIDSISELRNDFLEAFLNEDSYSDPILRYILLGHDCKFLVYSTSIDFCGFLQRKQKLLNMPSLLSDMEELLKQKRENFYNSDRSNNTLKQLQIEDYDVLIATVRVILEESGMVSTRTNIIFEDRFEIARTEGTIALIVSTITIIGMSWIIWMLVFRLLREDSNQFKNILKNFPPNMIISNFVLKSFLLKTSDFNFDSSKLEL